MSTYKRGAPNPLSSEMATSASALCDLVRDQLGNLTSRTALETWLAHPRTARFLERLRFTPGEAALWQEMQDLIATAREWAVDDRAPDAPPPSCTIAPAASTDLTDEEHRT